MSRTVLIGLIVTAAAAAVIFVAVPWRESNDEARGPLLRFVLDTDIARANGRVPEMTDDATLMSRTLAVLRARFASAGLRANITSPAASEIEVHLVDPNAPADFARALVEHLGDMRFAIEVLPRERYRHMLDDEAPPPRLEAGDEPWRGAGERFPRTEAGFEAFKAEEMRRWHASGGAAYRPSHPRYSLVLERDRQPTPQAFHLIEETPHLADVFDVGIIANPRVGEGMATEPVVVFDIRPDARQRFGDWTERNLRMPLAIVANGRYLSAPYIMARLDRNVQITMGRRPRAAMLEEARIMAASLQGGRLLVAPRFLEVVDLE